MKLFSRAGLLRSKAFLAVVVAPTLISLFYYGLIASDRYESEARFVVKSESQRPAPVTSLANLIQTTGLSAGQEQTNEVMDYIHSRNALADLSKQVDVRAKFGSKDADFLSRYPRPFTPERFETFYRYYNKMVSAKLDPNTGLAVLTVQAFTPQDAYTINAHLLGLSEALVNRLNQTARSNAISEAEKQVTLAERRVKAAGTALASYRNQNALLDPTKQAGGVFDIATKLASTQATLQAQLDVMRRVTPENPQIPSLERQIQAISEQIAAQNAKAVGPNSAISSKLTQYEGLALEQQFAAQMLTTAQTQLAQARAEDARQQFYLERVVEPNKPDMATLPNRLVQVLTIAGACFCLYLVGWMLVVGILEHAPED